MRLNKFFLFFFAFAAFACPAHADIIELFLSPVAMPSSSLPSREINVKVCFDFDGKCRFGGNAADTASASSGAGNNLSFSAEYIRYFTEYVGAGAGISAQMPRQLDGYPGKFGFIPLYLSLKIRSWPQEPGLCAYAFGQAGCNFFYGDGGGFGSGLFVEKNGFYYGAGFGIEYKLLLFEIMYGVNSGTVKDGFGKTADVDYGKFGFAAGLKL